MSQKLKEKNIKPVIGWDNGEDIFFVYRQNGEKKKCVIKNYQWFFAVHSNNFDKEKIWQIAEQSRIYDSPNPIQRFVKSGEFVRIYCSKRNKATGIFIDKLKENNIEPLEADLSLTKRYMVNEHVELEENLSFLFFDIETNDSQPGIVVGRDEILSWAAIDSDGKKFYKKSDSLIRGEPKLIESLLNLFSKYDLIIGWNSKNFDIPYIEARIEKLAAENKLKNYNRSTFWKEFIHIDLMQRFIKLFGPIMTIINLPGFSLDEVANTFLEKRKIKFSGSVLNLYKTDPNKLKQYNLRDVQILYELNEKLNTIPLMIKECAWTGTFMNRFFIGELLDNFILREARLNNYHMKTKPKFEENDDSIRVRGGFVMEPRTGLYDNVRTFDFRALYPSIIVGWNVGQDSLITGKISDQATKNFDKWLGERKIEEVDFKEWYDFLKEQNELFNPKNKYYQTGNNQFFCRTQKSIVSNLIKRLLKERAEYKKLQFAAKYGSLEHKNAQASQEVVKEMANSCYGICADKQSRFFDPRVAEAITLTGQLLNRTAIAIFEKEGFVIIGADTDSCFSHIDSDKKTEKITKIVNDKLTKHFKQRYKIEDNIIFLEYEKKFKKFLMQDKKRYSGWLTVIDDKPTDSIYTKGLENVRKNTIEFTRNKINELLKYILKENKEADFFMKWIENLKEYVLNENIPGEKLAITTKISKPIDSYKTKPPHVQLAEKLIKSHEILDTAAGKKAWGARIEYIIVDNNLKENKAILLRDFKGKWDRKYYWDVQIYAPLYRMLKAAWPDQNWDDHNILVFEKLQRKKEKEEERERKKQEKEAERKKKKREREQLRLEKKKKKQLTI